MKLASTNLHPSVSINTSEGPLEHERRSIPLKQPRLVRLQSGLVNRRLDVLRQHHRLSAVDRQPCNTAAAAATQSVRATPPLHGQYAASEVAIAIMFSLLSGCFEFLLRKEELKILIVGLDRSGKTTLLERLKTLYTDVAGLEADKVLPTVGLNLAHFEALGSPLLCWDVGGAAGLRGIWSKYYGECHAVVFCVDASDRGRLEEAKLALDRALGDRDLYGAPLLVLANKQDCEGAATPAEVAEAFGLGRLPDAGRAVSVQAVTAKTGEGVKPAVQWLVEHIRKGQRPELIRRKMLGS